MHKKSYTNVWNGLERGYFPYIRVWKIDLLLLLFKTKKLIISMLLQSDRVNPA